MNCSGSENDSDKSRCGGAARPGGQCQCGAPPLPPQRIISHGQTAVNHQEHTNVNVNGIAKLEIIRRIIIVTFAEGGLLHRRLFNGLMHKVTEISQ